jgi:hypothetical protein
MNRIIALWTAPRSVSTAFERMVRARGDLHAVHEPFVAYYYFGEDRVNDNYNEGIEPSPEHHWEAIRSQLLAQAASTPVFFKDMAYHVRKCLSPDFLRPFDSTFLVREPRLSLASLYRLQPNATVEEAGFEQLLRVMRMVFEREGEPLVAIDSEALRERPEEIVREYCDRVDIPFIPEALSWEPGSPSAEWQPWQRWHQEAIGSSGFETGEHQAAPEKGGVDAAVPPEVLDRCERAHEAILELVEASGTRLIT